MSLLILYPIYFSFLFFLLRKKKQHLISSSFVLLYLIASVGSCFIYESLYRGERFYLEAVLYHVVMLTLLLWPLRSFDKLKYIDFRKTNYKIILFLSVFIIISSLINISLTIPNINIALMLDNVGSLRKALASSELVSSNIFVRYLNYFAGGYWSVAMVLAFYFMKFYPKKKLLISLLLFSSLSVIFSSLTVAAREYIVKYVMVFMILTYFFHKDLNRSWQKKLKILFLSFVSISASLFILITLLRFGEDSGYQNSTFESILSYAGQGFIFFSGYFEEFPNGLTGGKIAFPIFAGGSMSAFNLAERFSTSVELNVFSTTIGSWIFEVGILMATIITLIHFLLFTHVGKLRYNVFKLIYVIWIYEFIFSALFFYNETLNGSRLLSIFFIVFLDVITRPIKKRKKFA